MGEGLGMRVLIVCLLPFPVVPGFGEDGSVESERMVKPILNWIYHSELPEKTVVRRLQRDRGFWSEKALRRITAESDGMVWVFCSDEKTGVRRFLYEIATRQLTETQSTEHEFECGYGIRDGSRRTKQFLTVRLLCRRSETGYEVYFETGGMCHGRMGAKAWFAHSRDGLVLVKVDPGWVKCCF